MSMTDLNTYDHLVLEALYENAKGRHEALVEKQGEMIKKRDTLDKDSKEFYGLTVLLRYNKALLDAFAAEACIYKDMLK